jgi:sugar-phosphatase
VGVRATRESLAGGIVTRLHARAVLFDLDGVLVDSRRCIEFVWRSWAEQRGYDPEPIIRVAHGRRISETLAEVAPGLDIATEVAILDGMEEVETRGVAPMPGAASFLRGLPLDRWAIVTSGSPAVASLRIHLAEIPSPRLVITAADVTRGKPAPDGYLQAAAALGAAPAECVVVEDAPAGVAAGKAAGMRVIAVAGTAPPDALREADRFITSVAALRVGSRRDGWLELTVGES